ncbi:MAG: competence protein, partial [Mycobacterium sp.]
MTTAEPVRTDLRLVPAALSCWLVTAAGLFWGPWAAGVAGLVVVVVVAAVGRWAGAVSWAAVLAVAVVGAAFAIVVALRLHAVRTHALASQFGHTVSIVASPAESPRPIAGGRLMFSATLREVQNAESSGRVMVFTPSIGYSEVSAGRPMAFRARVG